MPTTNLGLPTITGNQSVDIPRDFNALAEAVDGNAAKASDVATHLADYVKHPGYAAATGSANVYAVTLNPAPTAYTDGMAVSVKINVDSTAASTLNVNGLGAKALKKANGNDATNLKANGVYTFRYNSSTGNFILQGEGGSGNAVAGDVLTGKTFSNDVGDQVGTMPNRGAVTITPGTADQTISAGYHNGSGKVVGDPDLIASNILKDKNIFGVVGTVEPDPITSLIAGDATLVKWSGDIQVSSSTLTKVKEARINKGGTIRVKFTLWEQSTGMAKGQIYKNGVPYGIYRENYDTVSYTEDISVSSGDLIQLYAGNSVNGITHVTAFEIAIGNTLPYATMTI